MPGFPDKFMPFMDMPPGAKISGRSVQAYGKMISTLRGFTNESVNKEPKWRHRDHKLMTGYVPQTYGPSSKKA
jgi:hydrogenase small subunit